MAGNRRRKNSRQNLIVIVIIVLVLIGVPGFFLVYQSYKSGLTISEVVQRKISRNDAAGFTGSQAGKGAKIDFLVPSHIGQEYTEPPQVSHILATDLDRDGLADIIVCDARDNTVSWIRQFPSGVFTEKVIARGLIAPAHAEAVDFENDGDTDLVIAVLGMLFPNNDKIGSVVLLENDGSSNFEQRLVIDKIARVADARAADLDNDGDLDFILAQFGYDDGETRWIENMGNWQFRSHILQSLSGPINAEAGDYDGDGDLDIISLASQEWEEIWCFENEGGGRFKPKLIWGSDNEDFGSSGLMMYDLDGDGDSDILYTNGDAFDYIPPAPRPWHGVSWLENTGNLEFVFHRICEFAGAFSARPSDVDNDGDIDIFVVSGFNAWDKDESQSFIWLENTTGMQFTRRDIANTPTHLLTLDVSDFNNDGKIDFVTGGMHAYPPYDRMGRITLWMNSGLPQQ